MMQTKDITSGNSWNEKRNLHPEDLRLRLAGFKIVRRLRGQEAIWQSPEGQEMRQSEAVKLLSGTRKSKASCT
jgi:hypothetical protein